MDDAVLYSIHGISNGVGFDENPFQLQAMGDSLNHIFKFPTGCLSRTMYSTFVNNITPSHIHVVSTIIKI